MIRVTVVADPGDDDPGWVGERLRERGATLHTMYRNAFSQLPPSDLVLLLGSAGAVYDELRADAVEPESALVREAMASGVPVIAICYGAQLTAHALGGSVRAVDRGEVGWFEITSFDASLCPPGPWLQFHSDVFTPPPGSRVLGVTDVGPQGFALDPVDGAAGVVAWQFHPEATPAIVERWVGEAGEYVTRHGGDPEAVVHIPTAARARTFALVDAAVEHLLGAR